MQHSPHILNMKVHCGVPQDPVIGPCSQLDESSPSHLRSILIIIRWKVIKIYNILEAGSFPFSKQGKTAPLHCAWKTPPKWHRYLSVFFYFNLSTVQCQNVVLKHYSRQGSQTYRASVHHLLVEIITHCSLTLSLRHCQLLHPDSYCMSPRCSQVHTLIVLLLFLVTKNLMCCSGPSLTK
jgi:hypothetical protein